MSSFFDEITVEEAEISIRKAKEIVARVDSAIDTNNFSELRKLAREGYVSAENSYDADGMVSATTYSVADDYELCKRDAQMTPAQLAESINSTIRNLD